MAKRSRPSSQVEPDVYSDHILYEGTPVVAKLTTKYLVWYNEKAPDNELGKVDLQEIIGAATHRKNKTLLFVHACHMRKKGLFSSTISPSARERKTYLFLTDDPNQTHTWIKAIKSALAAKSLDEPISPRKFLVLYNPHKDSGAVEVFLETVKPMFTVANIQLSLADMKYPIHTKVVGQQVNPKVWDAIVCIGGDHLVNGLINGLMNRPDWKEASKIPIATIPTPHTTNLLANAIGANDAVTATFLAIKGTPCPLDVFSVLQRSAVVTGGSSVLQDMKRTYGILNISWGEDLKVDPSSKWMGTWKFKWDALKALTQSSSMRRTGRLSLFPAPSSHEKVKFDVPMKEEQADEEKAEKSESFWGKRANEVLSLQAQSVKNEKEGSTSEAQDKTLDNGKESDEELEEIQIDTESVVIDSFEKAPLSLWKEEDPFYSCPSENWISMEGELSFFFASKIWTVGSRSQVAPFARMNDGLIDVILIKKSDRSNSIRSQLLSKILQGTHTTLPQVEYYKVKGFSLEPTSTDGEIRVDGQVLHASRGPIRVEVHHGVARLISRGFSF